jgi:hypothetical protein
MKKIIIFLSAVLISTAGFGRQKEQAVPSVPPDLESIRQEWGMPLANVSPYMIERMREYKRYKESSVIKRIDEALEKTR